MGVCLCSLAPAGIEVVHLHGHPVGVDLAITEDDHLLFRTAVGAEQTEQILAHGGRAQLDEQLVVEILAGVFVLGQVSLGERPAGADILHPCLEDLLFGEDAFVDVGLALDDLAGGQIAVLLSPE